MKTMLFATCYIGTTDNINNKKRYQKWIDFYSEKLHEFNATYLFLIDDGSQDINLNRKYGILDSNELPNDLKEGINLVHFNQHLGRPNWNSYYGWWRSFLFSIILAEKYHCSKIIHIESDFFVVSKELIKYIKNIDSGWVALYSRFLSLPESAVQVVCRDQFGSLRTIHRLAQEKNFKYEQIAEKTLPFTAIIKDFTGDRLGDPEVLDAWLRHIDIPIKLDYIGQVPPEFNASDYEFFFQFDFTW